MSVPRASIVLPGPAIRCFLPNRLGGVTAYIMNLALARPPRAALELYWLDSDGTQAPDAADPRSRFDRVERIPHCWPGENLFAVLRRIHVAVTARPGVIVASEFFGLAYAARFGSRQHVVQILHGDLPMYYQLAEAFEPHVDVFVTVSARIRDELARRLPGRAADIRHLRSGVPASGPRRPRREGPLRLVYSGRLDLAKGVLDLPAIDRLARSRGADVAWTIIGAGSLDAALRSEFAPDAKVHFTGALPGDEARSRLAEHDVFVLPSRAEGLSLALLEAMGAGVVPVASDLASGMREAIEVESTGLLARPGHPEDFAEAISRLAGDRELLERMSAAAAARIEARHSLAAWGAAFYDLIGDLDGRPISRRPRFSRGPSRLDRAWLPNPAVRWIRAASRRLGMGG